MSWVWMGVGFEKTWECVLSTHQQFLLLYFATLLDAPFANAYPYSLCLEPKCGWTIPEFTETATLLNLKTMLLLIEPKMVMVQVSDQMTTESSMAPVVTSTTLHLRLQYKQQSEPARRSQKEGKRSRKRCHSESQRRKGFGGGCGERNLRDCLGLWEKKLEWLAKDFK